MNANRQEVEATDPGSLTETLVQPVENISENMPGPAESSANVAALRTGAGSINALIDLSCAQYSAQPAIGQALEQAISYGVLHKQILALALRLRQAGVGPGSRVAIMGENSANWVIAWLSTVRLGAAVVPVFPETPAMDLRHMLNQAGCDTLFVTGKQLDKIYDLQHQLETLITLDNAQDPLGLLSPLAFDDFLQEGYGLLKSDNQDPFPEVGPDELACILYTSGASGLPRAVMLSHANFCANAQSASGLIALAPGTVFVSVLPLSHAYEFTVGLLLPLLCGCRVAYVGRTPTPAIVQKICSHERPQVVLVAPLILEEIYKKRVMAQLENNRTMGFFCRFDSIRKLFFRKAGLRLMDFFGGRLRLLGIGGAALNPEIERFLLQASLPFVLGYGVSEASPLLAAGPVGDPGIAPGSTGKAVRNVRLRIDNPDPETGIGEIQAQGPNIMQGYLNDPEATKAALIEDGWLRTGDLGRLDEAGNLFICGRLNSVIVLASGENIYPEAIEHKLNAMPFVQESLVRENMGILEALVYPDADWLDSRTRGDHRAKRQEYLNRLLNEMRREVNESLPISSRINRVLVWPEPFSKTATHRIKRFLYTL